MGTQPGALALTLGGVILLAACSSAAGQANLSPSAAPSSPLAGCSLPYLKPVPGAAPYTGAFVSGTGGTWTADPSGQINQSGDLLVTAAKPTLTGSGFGSGDSGSYDAAVKRWLPVGRAHVRADGLAYAYAEPFKASASDALNTATRIHVVSLPEGADRVIYSGSPRTVLAYQPEGIYTAAVTYYSDRTPSDVERIDPSTGARSQMPNGVVFVVIDRGVEWTDGFRIMPTRLDRIEASTGTSQNWVETQGEGWIWFVGLDSNGHPLVDVSQGTTSDWKLFVYTAPQTRTAIADLKVHQLGISDSHGTWLAADDGIYLLGPDLKLVKVSDVTGGNVSGPCI